MTVTPEPARLFTTDLPGSGGRIGPEHEDFRVEEIPAYLPSGSGDHWYVHVEKRGMTTRDAALALARASGTPERDIGYAGMKDKHGVTRQWLSLPGKAPPPDGFQLPPEMTLLESSRHANKLRTGHLRGNRFRIGLVGAELDGEARAGHILERLGSAGHANYFGAQRFGRGGRNLEDALAWLAGRPLPRGRERFLTKLYASALQSEVYNRYLTRRLELGRDRLLAGEVVRLAGAGASFVVESVERETARLLSGDLVLTGPMPGPKMRPSLAEAAALERSVLEELGVGESALRELGRHAPGTRRDLLVRPEERRVSVSADRLVVEFDLPAGSYATVLVREITHASDPEGTDIRE